MTIQRFQLYDTTLRDGTQKKGLTLTVDEKLAVARSLDGLGVGYLEGGWPGAVPRDTEFFRRARTELDLRHARLAAFGATRRPGATVSVDPQVRALLEADTPVVTLVAKADRRHVERALRTTLAENLAMIGSTVRHLVHAGRQVFVDAEHYFEGYRAAPGYALETVRAAAEAGADAVVLCDTNGGTLPDEVRATVAATLGATGVRLGIHCHDDSGCAVAATLAAVDAGAVHAQGTAHGYGERCGNADLFSIAANLVLKRGIPCLPPGALGDMARIAREVAVITRVPERSSAPYVGEDAFTHKAGLHASALRVDPGLYQHTDPAGVGNRMRTVVSDLGGRSSVALKAAELGYAMEAGSEPVARTAARVKALEAAGHSFDSADASFELLLRAELYGDSVETHFTIDSWHVTVRGGGPTGTEAGVRLRVRDVSLSGTGRAGAPLHALDRALHDALDPFFPAFRTVVLVGERERPLGPDDGGDASCQVLLTHRADDREWGTVGVGGNAVAAGWHALLDMARHALLDRPRARAADRLLAVPSAER
ncbi:2-isopropylmalate synthase [Streptomyces sp. ADI96-02]|uniref:citramalate synthase n=1 Tax=Streptomyces sp. ADI96-02 TaxID=1522760 RepID=UPI000F54FD95|nr:citramalate synthase [Streptomyces sp. ADI96-02]RPK56958.1 2-isopropylmalate synthase [Streptomyces sp. ADI96-02]